ncbi:MAG: hypothetical protein H6736_18155 [Alphaproteobacteria bacterium]|nr:hypothetical protein [Alphaproteobacteria bacterium]MCB9693738.1 hypothetical protein [Alphaproteobacteria bacterium]
MTPAVKSFALAVVAWAVVCVGVFLYASDFFSTWHGQAVSVRGMDPDRAVLQVLVVEDDGGRFEAAWPREALDGMNLAIDRLALPPKPLPEGLPRTNKDRFALTFTLEPDGGGVRTVATTGMRPLGVALLIFLVGVGFRNMMVAGSPLALARPEQAPRTHTAAPPPPPSASASGASGAGRPRPKKGPPPGRPRRGSGRRG